MHVQHFFHEPTCTLTYVVSDPDTRDAVVIDPVLDFDSRRVSTSEASLAPVRAYVRERNLTVQLLVETHVHADHLSGQQALKQAFGAPSAISARIAEVQEVFADWLDFPTEFPCNGSQWDVLMHDGTPIQAGSLTLTPIATPGHTPACTCLLIGDCLFTGDTMFMPDFGTGRCDFPGGSAADLYDSITRLYRELPRETRVFVGHDYSPGGREMAFETTIGACMDHNKSLRATTPRDEFVSWRTNRDSTLAPPGLIFPSLTWNARAGHSPPLRENGRRYIQLPLGVFD